ncbi:MAG: hypothetical protein II315_07355 [Rikenellaceae bacterium]|nr:hypothetical protein [Rikenellaceae bacterium]
MKKLFISICAVLFALVVQAQEHMTFKGIPMDCDMDTFASQLEEKGYIKIPFSTKYIGDTMIVLVGKFAGVDKCFIAIQGTPISKIVWRVGVLFPIEDSWDTLKRCYESLKESYTAKYGKPDSFEYFQKPYYEGCGEELRAVELGKSNYSSYFFVKPKGGIVLTIEKNKQIVVSYEDDINTSVFEQENERIVSNDI